MKIILLAISFLLFINSCNESKNAVDDKSGTATIGSNEKSILQNSTGKKEYKITGSVTRSNSYCGGARPTDEMLREITAPQPVANTQYFIRKGNTNDVNEEICLTIQTDNEGRLNFKLPPGDYIIIEKNRLDSTYIKSVMLQYEKQTSSYTAADKNCLNKWLAGYLFQLKVISSDIDSVNINFHHGCWTDVPCVQYIGPYPP